VIVIDKDVMVPAG